MGSNVGPESTQTEGVSTRPQVDHTQTHAHHAHVLCSCCMLRAEQPGPDQGSSPACKEIEIPIRVQGAPLYSAPALWELASSSACVVIALKSFVSSNRCAACNIV